MKEHECVLSLLLSSLLEQGIRLSYWGTLSGEESGEWRREKRRAEGNALCGTKNGKWKMGDFGNDDKLLLRGRHLVRG